MRASACLTFQKLLIKHDLPSINRIYTRICLLNNSTKIIIAYFWILYVELSFELITVRGIIF